MLKKPLSFDEQIDCLIAHKMVIEDTENAKNILSQINYYRFTGYALQFRKDSTGEFYKEGTSFSLVWEIYKFDFELRNLLKPYLEFLEIIFRTKIAYGFSMEKSLKEPHDGHYDINNFYDKIGYKKIMDSYEKHKHRRDYSLFINHHEKKYCGKMPLWVLVELLSFSDLSKLYRAMYESDQNNIASLLGVKANYFKNHLHCLSVLRNKCAHGIRLYNTVFNPPVSLKSTTLKKNREISTDTLFAYLIILTRRLPRDKGIELIGELKKLIEKYSKYINLSLLGMDIGYNDFLLKEIINI